MGIWFEIVSDPGGMGILVMHVNMVWFVVIFLIVFLWHMIVGGRRGGRGRY